MADRPHNKFQDPAEYQSSEVDLDLIEVNTDAAETGSDANSFTLRHVPRLLINRRWWWTTFLVIAGMILLARLGIWQLDRLGQRRNQNTLLLQQMNASPIKLDGNQLTADPDELVDRLATVRGEFDYDSQIVLTQQRLQGRPGVHLVTPLKIDGSSFAVLVDRGWIPAREAADGDLYRYNEDSMADVQGVVRPSEEIASKDGDSASLKTEWYRIDISEIDKQIPYNLLPIYLKWLPDELDSDPPIRTEREVDLSEGSHLGYAIQWFIFTLLLGGGYIVLILRQENK